MDIVINNCFGGFNLSYAGVMEYARRAGLKLYAYKNTRKGPTNSLDFKKYLPWNGRAPDSVCPFYSTGKLTKKGNLRHRGHFTSRDIKRDDPHLIATVKKLGKRAWGKHAELKIVRIPKDVKWHIAEYDGNEHVAEDHRIWG